MPSCEARPALVVVDPHFIQGAGTGAAIVTSAWHRSTVVRAPRLGDVFGGAAEEIASPSRA